MAVVHTGSASGGFVAPLSGPNRIIVAATRTARERNATEFPGYFVEAVAGDGADLDKDGAVSLLEAFIYARQEVARHYEEENELLTEHAVLDDNGDGEGSRDAERRGQDGRLAATFRLGRPARAVTADPEPHDDPVLARLYGERAGDPGRASTRCGPRKDTMAPGARTTPRWRPSWWSWRSRTGRSGRREEAADEHAPGASDAGEVAGARRRRWLALAAPGPGR